MCANADIGERRKQPPEVRFWRHVSKCDGCWLWTGALSDKGYGRFQLGSGLGTVSSHRFAWQMQHGPIPFGLVVMHQCDEPKCVNVNHLMLGTSWANAQDMVVKGRSARGSRHSQAVLTESIVIELRRRFGAGEKLKDLAAEMGIVPSTAHAAVYSNWSRVEPYKRTKKVSARGKR